MSAERRIVALVLPNLICELVREATALGKPRGRERREPPFAVVIVDADSGDDSRATKATTLINAVNPTAHRLGLRKGQTIAEARAFVAQLVIHEVTLQGIRAALGKVAEVALALGTVAAIEVPDTVWLDITGAAHLAGGETELATDLVARVRALGHSARVGVSVGPRLAQAFARWVPSMPGKEAISTVEPTETIQRLSALPVISLPIDAECASWFVRLGVHTVGELRALPRAAAAARLGPQAPCILEMIEGRDTTPLVPYEPAAVPFEEISWEDPVDGSEPLLFVLRGLVSRLSARLEGRGEAAQGLELVIEHDRSIARLRKKEQRTTLRFDLASPLWREEELRRIVTARLQRTTLDAPSRGVCLRATAITRALKLQLDLSRGMKRGSGKGPEMLPVLLGELAADIGKSQFGIFELRSAHRPEEKSRKIPVPESEVLATLGAARKKVAKALPRPERGNAPTRLLPRPVLLDASMRVGATVSIDHRLYTIERIAFEERLDSVEWWTQRPASRDYLRLWLTGPQSSLEALVYVNRETGSRFLQAICD